jgi:DNA-binding MarR family transcriptional regulator
VSKTIDYRALAEFRHQLRIFLSFSETNVRKAGLTSQQYQALLAVRGWAGQNPMHVGELARLLLIKHHTAGELVARMTSRGLLRRTVDAMDNRRVLLTLTKKGMDRLEKVAVVNFKHLGGASSPFSKILKLIGQTSG